MNQFSLRRVPLEVERRLRAVAQENGESLNEAINRILAESLGVVPEGSRKRDLSDLAGTWSQEEADEFERATEHFGQIDDEMWEEGWAYSSPAPAGATIRIPSGPTGSPSFWPASSVRSSGVAPRTTSSGHSSTGESGAAQPGR